jgi:Protein of unknown function (DUF1553)/Protein of unknown function (DUF1549)/Planctomycete cytochrome C
MSMGRHLRNAVATATFAVLGLAAPARAQDFESEIRPIFEQHCVGCHGPKKQESLLRLDGRRVLVGGMSGEVVVPGRSGESLLVQHLTGASRPRMPFEKPPLDAALVARIAAWIDAGARGLDEAEPEPKATHWAYVKPLRPKPPAVRDAAWVRSPIDAFVLARLESEGLSPSPEAARETLVRRLSLDLVGLPPTPREVDAFLTDSSPGAYAALVDRLLASPRYGERWARPWLDLARYADTNGYEKDQRRTAWKYRDWVIAALNRDLSFRDFTIQQLAGDMLDGAGVDEKIATGFHRNSQLNQEGGIDVEEQRFETLVDRVATTGSVWLGSTIACAQCHNHKFDPFPQKDYYRVMAFFDNGVYRVHGQGEEVVDRWIVEPELELATEAQARRREALRREADELRFEVKSRDLEADIAAFAREISGPPPAFTPLRPLRATAASGAALKILEDGSLLASGKLEDKDSYTVTVRASLPGITAFRLEALPDPSLPQGGPGRASSGVYVVTSLSVSEAGRSLPLARGAADINEKGRHAALLVDAHAATGWGVTADAEAGRAHAAIVTPKRPLAAAAGPRTLTFTLQFEAAWPYTRSSLGRFRLSATSARRPFAGLPVPEDVRPALEAPAAERSAEQKQALVAWFRPMAPALDTPRDRIRAIDAELDAMNVVTALVMQERPGFERPSTLLRQKGSFTSPGERVYAALPAVLGALPEDQPSNRLGLARWLVGDDNPLTARVAVNRFWETLFGRGLVATLEDFGSQGERPSHPELVDWLAVEFMERGWSQKAILREIVSSATYRQSSAASEDERERDPDNRLLARGARYRVEAEAVRDIALSAAGLLSPKLGGPSVYPPQPDGVWNVPYSQMKWETSSGEDARRRSLYTFIRRSSPYPSLASFDAPSREQCAPRRLRTNTPLQALTTLNDPVFVAAAKALAERMAREGGAPLADRIGYGYRVCTARRPAADDLEALVALHAREAARLGGGAAAEERALASVASVLLNLDATLTRE